MKGYFESTLKQHGLYVGQRVRANLMRFAIKCRNLVYDRQTPLVDIADHQFSVWRQNTDEFFKYLAGV